MAITELGACEWFVWDLRRSNLIDRGQLDQIVGEFLKKQPRAEPPALADFLVNEEILTPFQAERLLQGKTQGMVLGPYTLTDALGAGSMGTVYKALSRNDNQLYAIKVLPRRSMWNVRIARRQVRAFEQCQHPAVVPFVDVGTAGSTHYLAWPLVEGETLDNVVSREGKLSTAVAAHYVLEAAEGLEICHQQGLIHGLIKPSNLLIGTDRQVRILDFGIGSLLAESGGESLVDTMSTANSLTSGLDCASPESILEPTNRTPAGDQYSLGCVLYFCLTGRYPFAEGTAVEKMMAHQMKQPARIQEFNPDVPEILVTVVDRMMQKAPEARFGSMSEVVEALRPFVRPSSARFEEETAASTARGHESDRQTALAGLRKAGRAATLASRSSATAVLGPTRASIHEAPASHPAARPSDPHPPTVQTPATAEPNKAAPDAETGWNVWGLVVTALLIGALIFLTCAFFQH